MMQRVTIFLLVGSLSYAQCQLLYAQAAATFPVVDPATQKARDADRRYILESEMQAERQALAKAQATVAAAPNRELQTDIHRHLENIKALQRELDSASGRQRVPRESVRVIARTERTAAVVPKAEHSPAFPPHSTKGMAAYWNPYNRAPDPAADPEVTAALSTTPRSESP